jgi:hypothetical protein
MNEQTVERIYIHEKSDSVLVRCSCDAHKAIKLSLSVFKHLGEEQTFRLAESTCGTCKLK